MRESSCPPLSRLPEDDNLTDLLLRNVKRFGSYVAYRRKVGATHWSSITWQQFHDEVRRIAKGLIAAGIEPGDRVGIMSRTRYEWTLMDIAILYAGGITVPVYETSSTEQTAWILSDSGVKGILTEDDSHADRVKSAAAGLDSLEHIWTISSGDLTHLIAAGKDISDEALESARSHARRGDVATIIYTSGTTGKPKGCCLTHGNFGELAENAHLLLADVLASDNEFKRGTTLLFIPLAHVFARFVQYLCLANANVMGHTPDIRDVTDDLASFKPTFLLSVPRVFEKVYNSAEQKARTAGKGKIFTSAARTAVAYSRSIDEGGPSLPLRLRHKLFDALVYRKIRAAMGGELKYCVSGGAPLGERLAHFFRGAGVYVLEGYGLTESTAPTCVNTPDQYHIGTVGLPLPGCSIKIADDGEILLQGVHIFKEYHGRPDATAEALSDGWFRTGDIGALTPAGALKITGRKKELIVTAGGKNVVPTILEDRMRMHPLVSQAVVVGDGKPFVAALVTLDAEMLPTWLKAEEREDMPVEQALNDPDVQRAIQASIDDANEQVSRAESIRKYTILPVDFTTESGHLTPSMKMRRSIIMRDFEQEIAALYGE